VRVVFMGTPEFAVPSLRLLAQTHEVLSVYTRPDAVSGRGSATRPSPVKIAALDLGIDVRQPSSLRDPHVQSSLAALRPEVIVVAAYGLILPREVLELPEFGCVNVHASLLPRWRGAAPIHRAILAGDAETGVSVMLMEEGLDTGPYCVVERVQVADKSVDDLTSELAAVGADALLRALSAIADGTCSWTEQDDSKASYAEKIQKHEVTLEPSLAVSEALRRIRASSRQAPARALIAGKGVTVESGREGRTRARAGSVAPTSEGLLLGFSDGALEILAVKPDGKASMAASDWARGLRLSSDAEWVGPR